LTALDLRLEFLEIDNRADHEVRKEGDEKGVMNVGAQPTPGRPQVTEIGDHARLAMEHVHQEDGLLKRVERDANRDRQVDERQVRVRRLRGVCLGRQPVLDRSASRSCGARAGASLATHVVGRHEQRGGREVTVIGVINESSASPQVKISR
jgi:hypothetical protein